MMGISNVINRQTAINTDICTLHKNVNDKMPT